MNEDELKQAGEIALSIRIQFPKFSKGFNPDNFDQFINEHIGKENVVSLCRLSYPNEWSMQLKSLDVREKLVKIGRTKINERTCWISPLDEKEVRGLIRWLPYEVSNESVKDLLQPYGDVLYIELQKVDFSSKVFSDERYFAMILKEDKTVDDIPHFPVIMGFKCLITIRGRTPSCFHCQKIGHRKSACRKFKEKLKSYSNRPPGSGAKRTTPRGKRYDPNVTSAPPPQVKPKKKKKKKAKAASNVSASSNIEESLPSDIKIEDCSEAKASNSEAKASNSKADSKSSNVSIISQVQDLINRVKNTNDVEASEQLTLIQRALAESAINSASDD